MASAVVLTRQELLDRNEARYTHAGYRETHALLLHWEDDDLNARSSLRSLEFVLRDNYAVTTRLMALPSREYVNGISSGFKSSERTLEREIAEFVRLYSAPDILLIVVYLGRGTYDDTLTFTFSGFSKTAATDQCKIIPKVSWSVANSGLIEAASDVVMLIDLRGDLGDEVPPVVFDTSKIPQEHKQKDILISYSGTGTPGDNGKSFAYTKILRNYLRDKSSDSRVMINEVHKHIANHINMAIDHGGLAFSPLFNKISLDQNLNIPLITFDITESSANILSGSGDYKWGPLGRLPLGWEKAIDNTDQYWRPYFKDEAGTKHATRPWSSACRANDNEAWDPDKFAKAGAEHVLSRMNASGKHIEEFSFVESAWVTAGEDFSTWIKTFLSHQKEAALQAAADQEAALREVARHKAAEEEVARQEEIAKQEQAQQEALQQLAYLQRQEADRQFTKFNPRSSGLGQSIYARDENIIVRGRARVRFFEEAKETVIGRRAATEFKQEATLHQANGVISATDNMPDVVVANAWEAFVARKARR